MLQLPWSRPTDHQTGGTGRTTRAVICARFSTELQNEKSIAAKARQSAI
jgi:hypothetical protein